MPRRGLEAGDEDEPDNASIRRTFRVERIEVFRALETFAVVNESNNRIEKTIDADRRAWIDEMRFQLVGPLAAVVVEIGHTVNHSRGERRLEIGHLETIGAKTDDLCLRAYQLYTHLHARQTSR